MTFSMSVSNRAFSKFGPVTLVTVISAVSVPPNGVLLEADEGSGCKYTAEQKIYEVCTFDTARRTT